MRTETTRTSPTRTATSHVQIEGLTSQKLAVQSEINGPYDLDSQHEAETLAEAEAILLRRWAQQDSLQTQKDSRRPNPQRAGRHGTLITPPSPTRLLPGAGSCTPQRDTIGRLLVS